MFKITVPASTANLGAGFDCLALALQCYLSVTGELIDTNSPWQLTLEGEGAASLPANEQNFIIQVAQQVAQALSVHLPSLHLTINNQIPLSRGLGSSAAAITAGIAIVEAVMAQELRATKFYQLATRFEPHADNLAAARSGGFTLACQAENGNFITLKQPWPPEIQALVAIPEFELATTQARAVLPTSYSREAAIFNIQHALLLQGALAQGHYHLLTEALKDRIHQPFRAPLVPGLVEALQLSMPGLLGVVLSGAGPTLLALATDNFSAIAQELIAIFATYQLGAQTTCLEIDQQGRKINFL